MCLDLAHLPFISLSPHDLVEAGGGRETCKSAVLTMVQP